jgi:dienelactone hydrolase
MVKLEKPSKTDTLMDKINAFIALIMSIPAMLMFVWLHYRDLKKHLPLYDNTAKELKKSHGIEKVGIVGYCFGGFICLPLGSRAESSIDAFATAHAVIKVPKSLEKLVKPGLIVCADNDFGFPKSEIAKAEAVLKTRPAKVTTKFYPGTYHGFAVRGHDDNGVIQAAKEDAFKSMVDFFNENFNSSKQ